MTYPPQQGPPPGPAWTPQPASPARKWKIAGLGCGGLLGVFLIIGIIGAIVSPAKTTSAAPVAIAGTKTTPAATSAAPTTAAPTTAVPTTAAPPAPAPTTSKPAIAAVIQLTHGAQHGLTNCVITYKDAQTGAGTSTFTAIVLDNSGKPYSPTGANSYSILLQMNLTDTTGTAYPVSEALGNGSRTAADNGGSDWFTTNQGDAQVSANSTQGVVAATVTVPLAQMKSVEGNILITSQNDQNYLKQTECAVRPSQG